MDVAIDIKPISCHELFDFFSVRIGALSPNSAVSYQKAFSCFKNYIKLRDYDSLQVTESFLEDWYVYMMHSGLTYKTVLYYFDNMQTLYNSAAKEGLVQPENAFASVKRRIKASGAGCSRGMIAEEDFRRMLNITKAAGIRRDENALAADLVSFSLYNAGMDPVEVALLKKADADRFGDFCREIAERYMEPRRNYIFPFDQSLRTKRKLEAAVRDTVISLFRSKNIPVVNDVAETLRSFWAFAALRSGVPGSQIVGLLGCRPAGVPLLSVCTGVEVDAALRSSLPATVADEFFSNRKHWFAMRMRHGVKFEQITRRIEAFKSDIQEPEFFYPQEEIARRIGKKLVYKRRPIIGDVAFFRSYLADVYQLFRRIGDLAWCYTNNTGAGNTYAMIPDSSMMLFQRTIGKFTPDHEFAPIGTFTPERGAKVVIVGGVFAGNQAIFEGSDPGADDGGMTIYRLMLLDNAGFEWRVRVDSRLVKPADSI